MLTPLTILFCGSVAQIIFLAGAGWWAWQNTTGAFRPLFIKRWSENISLEIVNKISLPVLIMPLGFVFAERKQLFAGASDHFEFSFANFLFATLVLDLIFYWRHRIYHRWLERWHRLHHDDSGYDVSLTLRFHPVENLVNYLIIFLGILWLGMSALESALVIQLFALQALISHTAPDKTGESQREGSFWDRILVTPSVHRRHHDHGESAGNFGFLFSFWDRIFKTTLKESL